MKKVLLALVIAVCMTALLAGCASRTTWTLTTVDDKIKQVATSTLMYEEESGFTLGTKGTGEYNAVKVTGTELLKN